MLEYKPEWTEQMLLQGKHSSFDGFSWEIQQYVAVY